MEKPIHLKLVTAAVTVTALGLALSGNQSVFDLVILSWSTLACAFAPLLVLYAFNQTVNQRTALLVTASGVLVSWLWRLLGWQDAIYEGLPGITFACALGIWLCRGGAAQILTTGSITDSRRSSVALKPR